jgi:hypothetical protein
VKDFHGWSCWLILFREVGPVYATPGSVVETMAYILIYATGVMPKIHVKRLEYTNIDVY